MKQLMIIISILLIIPISAFSGTANCDEDRNCRHVLCEKNQTPYCATIKGTSGPNGKAMGFCKCK